MAVEAVLFDSGGTLVRPTAQSWMPGKHFEEFAASNGVPYSADSAAWRLALRAGDAVLAAHPRVPTIDDEVELFSEFFHMVGRTLGMNMTSDVVASLAAESVHGRGHEVAYEGAEQTLTWLRQQGLKLMMLANGWPSLHRRYEDLGLRNYFDFFATSTQIGIKKPNPQAFRLVCDLMNVQPARTLLVDDLGANLIAADGLGMPGVLVTHATTALIPHLDWIPEVRDLPARPELFAAPALRIAGAEWEKNAVARSADINA